MQRIFCLRIRFFPMHNRLQDIEILRKFIVRELASASNLLTNLEVIKVKVK